VAPQPVHHSLFAIKLNQPFAALRAAIVADVFEELS
jgi:hypothetical protein